MARQTRDQRRARRGREPALAGGPPAAPPQRPVANGGSEPAPRPAPRPAAGARRPGFFGTMIHFVQESIAELKKVEWPNQKQVVTGTTVVLIACIVVGIFLYVNDLAWKHVVHWLINL
jgi:preprotein translocase subunit SecE